MSIRAMPRPVGLHPALWSALAGVGVALALGWRALHPPLPLPVYSPLPALSLIDQDAKPFTLDRLRGHVSIANFIFTSCPSVCPLLSARMQMLQERLRASRDRVQLVSFSVDPETDTPAVLKAYGERYRADSARWTFVTGPADDVIAAVGDGFKVALTREKRAGAPDSPDGFAIVHGENLVLVDADARIRGYYHKDDADLERLLADAGRLERAGGR